MTKPPERDKKTKELVGDQPVEQIARALLTLTSRERAAHVLGEVYGLGEQAIAKLLEPKAEAPGEPAAPEEARR